MLRQELLDQFPPRREAFKGELAPIWCEPMIGSGERVCCGVAVVCGNHSLVRMAPGFTRFAAIYGGDGEQFLLKCARACLDWLVSSFRENRVFPTEPFPIEGFMLGERTRSAGNSLDEIAVTGFMRHCSFCTKDELKAMC